MGLSLVLIFGAALFLHSYWRLATADHGFTRANVLLIQPAGFGGDFGVDGEVPHERQFVTALFPDPGCCARGSGNGLVMRDVIAMTISGLVVGTLGGLAGARLLAAMLYEIGPGDPITLGVAAATLTLVAAVAGYIPARRAARIDPMECLRSQ